MATPVPYEGAPDRVPGQEGIAPINVGANPNAFGVNVAEAVGHLGQVQEGAGKELFDRAYAMQELQVHADVNARLAKVQNDMSNHYVDFLNLEGKNAVDGLGQYQSKLDGIREQGGNGLSPIGQEFYDTESRNWRNRFGMYGAEHAGQEQKKYIVGAADAQISSNMKTMEINPSDPAGAEAALQNIRGLVAHKYADIGGMSPEEVKSKQADAVNVAVQNRIRALAKPDPNGAQKLFDQATKDGDIYGNEAANLSWYIRNQRNLIGSRTTANQAFVDLRNDAGPMLRALLNNESGGKIHITQGNIGDINNLTGDLAQGAFQITTGTWHEFAERAGIDLAAFPNANSAPYAVQAKMASVIPLRRWGAATIEAMRKTGATLDLDKSLGENLAANGEGLGTGAGMKDPSLEQLTTHARALAQAQFPDDDEYAQIVEDRVITQFNKEQSIRRDTDFNNEQSIANALIAGVGPDKKIPTSIDELKLDPKAGQAWDDLEAQHPTELNKFMNIMAKNARGDVAMTTDRLQNWQRLSGEAIQDPQAFMAETNDISKLDLPNRERLAIVNMRGQIYKKQDASPQVSHAMSVINRMNMLGPLGITKDQNANALAMFTGVLGDAMTQYQESNGKPMSDEDIKTTAQQLLTPTGGGGFFHPFGGGKTPWFQSIDEVPNEISETIRQDFESKGIQPSDAQILQEYLAAQYNELFAKKSAAYKPQRYPPAQAGVKAFQ